MSMGSCDDRITLYPAAPLWLATLLHTRTIAREGWGSSAQRQIGKAKSAMVFGSHTSDQVRTCDQSQGGEGDRARGVYWMAGAPGCWERHLVTWRKRHTRLCSECVQRRKRARLRCMRKFGTRPSPCHRAAKRRACHPGGGRSRSHSSIAFDSERRRYHFV
jgi:hypothetical protein